MIIHWPNKVTNHLLPSHRVQFSSVTQSCQTLFDPMDCSTPGLPVHHQLPKFTQAHVHWVSDAIQPFILCRPILLQPSIFPSIRVFSNELQSSPPLSHTDIQDFWLEDEVRFILSWVLRAVLKQKRMAILNPTNHQTDYIHYLMKLLYCVGVLEILITADQWNACQIILWFRLIHQIKIHKILHIILYFLQKTWASLLIQQQRICLQCRRHRFDPWVGQISWRREWQLTPIFLPGKCRTESPGGLQSMGSQTVGYNLETKQRKHVTNEIQSTIIFI